MIDVRLLSAQQERPGVRAPRLSRFRVWRRVAVPQLNSHMMSTWPSVVVDNCSESAFSVAIKPRLFIARKEIAFAATKKTPSESTLGALRLLPQLRPFLTGRRLLGTGRPAWLY